MFIRWHRIWDKDSQHQQQHHQHLATNSAQKRQSHIENNHRTIARHHHHHHHHQLPYSVHNNCEIQSKCIRKSSTDQSSRMNSFCSIIILIHCFNVFVLAIASENLSNNSQQQPCDRSRRVFTDMQGEISNGPPGYNYTQVSKNIFFWHTHTCTRKVLLSSSSIVFHGRCTVWLCFDRLNSIPWNVRRNQANNHLAYVFQLNKRTVEHFSFAQSFSCCVCFVQFEMYLSNCLWNHLLLCVPYVLLFVLIFLFQHHDFVLSLIPIN